MRHSDLLPHASGHGCPIDAPSPRAHLRRCFWTLLIVAGLAACGGGDSEPSAPDVPKGPDTPTVGAAAALVKQAGDAQAAFPGGALAVAPSVVVRDANGRAVPGATVTFAVVSGGGSIANGSTTSDSQGLAAAGSWTIGSVGDQVLEARVGALPPVRFVATISTGAVEAVIPSTGGIVEITTLGHPYRGLKLTIPDGAYAGSGTWRVELAAGAPTPTLPSGFTVIGPALRIETDRTRAGRLMTLRIPAPRIAGAARFFVVTDPVRSVREMLPIISEDSASITVLVGHLNASLLLGRSASPLGAISARQTANTSSMWGHLTSVQLSALGITGTTLLNYLNQILPAPDVGSYAFPAGHGPASALMNMYSQLSNQYLSAMVNVTPFGTLTDTATFATLQIMARQHRVSAIALKALDDYSAAVANLPAATRDSLAAINLWGGLAISGLPQLMMFQERFGASPGRRTFATMFGNTNGTTRFASASSPTTASTLTLGPNGFASRVDKEVVDAAPLNAQAVLPLGGSFVYPVEESRSFYDKMLLALAKQGAARHQANTELAADANLPDVTFEVQYAATGAWTPVDATVVIRDSSAVLRAHCSNCTQALPQNGSATQQTLAVDNKSVSGVSSLQFGLAPPSTSAIFGALGLGDLMGAAMSRFDAAQALSQLSTAFRPAVPFRIPLALAIFTIAPDSQLVAPDSLAQFSATVSLPPTRGYVIDWDFGDGTSVVRVSNAVGASHRYTTSGTYQVKATLRFGPNTSAPNVLLATAKGKVVVKPLPIWAGWRVTSLSTSVEDQYRNRILPGSSSTYWDAFKIQAQQDPNPTKRAFVAQVAADEQLLQRVVAGTTPAALVYLARDTSGVNSFQLTRGMYFVSGANVPAISRVLPQGLDRYSSAVALSVLPYTDPANQQSCNPTFGWSYAESGQLRTGGGTVAGSNWWFVVNGNGVGLVEPLRTTTLSMTVTGDNAVGTITYKYRLNEFCGNGIAEQNPWYVTATFAATRIK